MQTTMLIIHVKKGASIKPGSLVGKLGVRADYIVLPNGDAVGVFHAYSAATARQMFAADPLVTVFPPMHRPLTDQHVALLPHLTLSTSDTTYDAAGQLFSYHKMPWFHPEEGPFSGGAFDNMSPPV